MKKNSHDYYITNAVPNYTIFVFYVDIWKNFINFYNFFNIYSDIQTYIEVAECPETLTHVNESGCTEAPS